MKRLSKQEIETPSKPMRICKRCNKYFENNDKYPRKYCSEECRRAKPLVEKICLSSSALGEMSELIVCSDLLRKGFYVFKSITSNNPIDIVAIKDNKTIKIEVKTGRINPYNGALVHPVPRNKAYDVLAVYNVDSNTVIYTPTLPN